MKIDLVVGPLKLPHHPKRAAQSEQHPEDVAPPVRRTGIEKQPGISNQGHRTLDDISKNHQRLRTAGMRQRDACVKGQDNQPYAYSPGDRAGASHTLRDSSIDFRNRSEEHTSELQSQSNL